MKQVKLGSQGMIVSAQGLGCMGMSTAYGPSDKQESLVTLARAFELGVTFFDTAEVYGPYLNEELLGEFFADKRNEVAFATKIGFKLTVDGRIELINGKPLVSGEPGYLRSSVEGSLRRLKTDCVDLLYLHRIDPFTPIEETIGALSRFVSEGKVRYIGVSEASAETIRRAHSVHALTAVQTEYSLFERGVERNDVLATTRELGIGFVSYAPLGRGILSGDFVNLETLSATDFRRSDPRFQGQNFQSNLRLVNGVKDIAAAKGITPSQLAIAWTMNAGTVPIPGTRRVKFLEENVAAANILLHDEELVALNAVAPLGAATGDRYAPALMETLGH